MSGEFKKIGVTVSDWEAIGRNPDHLKSFIAALEITTGVDGAIVMSQTPVNAPTVRLREFIPRAFLTDRRMLSLSRLARLCDRLLVWDGKALKPQNHAISNAAGGPRLGFIVSNGFGLGHVTRMTAIAAGLAACGPQSFMSFSGGLVKNAFYLPSYQYLQLDETSGADYTRDAAMRFFNYADPTHIFYDGNVLPDGMLQALSLRPHIHLTWIRRGMWQANTAPKFMAQQALCDLVIEPGDLADSYDTGPSWVQRLEFCPPRGFLKTPPIRPAHDASLEKKAALRALGLDPAKQYALLMLGATQKTDDAATLKSVVAQVQKSGDIIPVIAHWPIAHDAPPEIPGALTIECLPIAPYYRGFDVIISAAGYNSFHEIIAAGLPAIFIPQEDKGRDQQLARARFAADRGFAQLCRRTDLENLYTLIPRVKSHGGTAQWFEDYAPIANAMGITPAQTPPPQPHDTSISPRIFKRWRRAFARRYGTLENIFVVVLGVDTERFFKKIGNPSRHTTIIITDSVDPIALRRAGYKYLWLNTSMLGAWGLKRQFLTWLKIWQPKKIKIIS